MTGYRLSRSVQCNWTSCGNLTRDPSMYCVHHQRSSQHGTVTPYRDGGQTVVSRMRLAAASAGSQGAMAGWIEEQRRVGEQALALYPAVRRAGDGYAVDNAVLPSEPGAYSDVRWSGEETGWVQIPAGPEYTVHGGIISLDGTTLRVRPNGSVSPEELQRIVTDSASNRWSDVLHHSGIVDNGEQYDDRAEIMSQFGFGDDPNVAVKFASATGDDLVVYVTEETPSGRAQERYVLTGVRVDEGPRMVTRTVVNAPASRTVTTAKGSALVEVPEGVVASREPLLADIAETNDLVSAYSLRVRGKIVLPMGWADQEL